MARLKKKPYKAADFSTYVLWKGLASILRGRPQEYLERIGIDNPASLELLQLKNQKEFAKKFAIDSGTLSDWNKRIETDDLTAPYRTATLKSLVNNVNVSLAATMIQSPTPQGVRVLNDYLKDSSSKQWVEIDGVFKKRSELTEEEKFHIQYRNRPGYSPAHPGKSWWSEEVRRVIELAYAKKEEEDKEK